MKDQVKLVFIAISLALAAWIIVDRPVQLGLDLQGGTQTILEAQDSPTVKVDLDAMLGVLSVIRNRVDSLGVSEPIIQLKGNRQLIVELPGIKNPQRAIDLIGQTALLEFVDAEWAPENSQNLSPEKLEILAGKDAKISMVKDYDRKGKLISERPIFLKETVITGKDLKKAIPGTSQYSEPIVSIEFTKEGSKKFYDITKRSVGKPLAIVLDGTIISAPNINEPISGGKAQISGSFSIQEMRDLVIKLKAGALPVPVEIVSNKIVGPTLGKDSINKSKEAALMGIGILLLFMLIAYRLPGFSADVALVCYIILCFATLKLFNATLTLPGIAGFILSIGMAVDANVIIFERIKEEYRKGSPSEEAISKGFSKAFVAIVDANITTLIAACVLFFMGSGSIKGFAVTLSIGILVSMFTAILFTRTFLSLINKSSKKGLTL